jgi:hypothetical protein
MIEKSKYEETQVKLSEQPAKSVYPVLNEKTEDNLLVSADSKSSQAAHTAEQLDFLRVTPHQFVRAKSGKYEPTVRPNFFIPLILLFASLIPFICFGTLFVLAHQVQLTPVHYMTDPLNPIKVMRILAFFAYISIPSMLSVLVAMLLMKIQLRNKAIALAIWIAVVSSVILILLCQLEYPGIP